MMDFNTNMAYQNGMMPFDQFNGYPMGGPVQRTEPPSLAEIITVSTAAILKERDYLFNVNQGSEILGKFIRVEPHTPALYFNFESLKRHVQTIELVHKMIKNHQKAWTEAAKPIYTAKSKVRFQEDIDCADNEFKKASDEVDEWYNEFPAIYRILNFGLLLPRSYVGDGYFEDFYALDGALTSLAAPINKAVALSCDENDNFPKKWIKEMKALAKVWDEEYYPEAKPYYDFMLKVFEDAHTSFMENEKRKISMMGRSTAHSMYPHSVSPRQMNPAFPMTRPNFPVYGSGYQNPSIPAFSGMHSSFPTPYNGPPL